MIPLCVSAETTEISETTDEISAEEELLKYSKLALDQLDLEKDHLAPVKALYKERKYVEALRAYKPIFFANIKALADAGFKKSSDKAVMKYADELLENYVYVDSGEGNTDRVYMGESGNWNWYPENRAFELYGIRLTYLQHLYLAYCETKDVKYLDKVISIWEDFDTNWLNQYNAKRAVSRYKHFGNLIELDRVGQLYVGFRMNNRVNMLITVAREDYDALYNAFSDITFAKMCYFMPYDSCVIQIGTETPNQFIYGIGALIAVYNTFGDFTPVVKRYNEGVAALKAYLMSTYLPDGGDTEQSFHYNTELPSLVNNVVSMFESAGASPDWLEELNVAGVGRVRMLSSVVTPIGETPSIAEDFEAENVKGKITTGVKDIRGDKLSEAIINNIWGDKSIAPPAFTSIAFPYVGYYVMRQNWEPDSHYLFMMGSRFGPGHTESNKLDIQYTAFGERLLTSSSNSYSQDPAILPYNDFIDSIFGNNTIAVDGFSQKRDYKNLSDFSTAQSGLWHTSNNFDLAESTFSDGYNPGFEQWDARKNAQVNDVKHTRRLLFDKENEVAIVVDDINALQNHTYQLMWNLARKFNTYDSLTADSNEKWIKTCLDDGKGGLELYNFYDGDLGYEVYVGENEDTVKGWYIQSYGINYEPAAHIETVFTGEGNQQITTLINPTFNNKSQIKQIEEQGEGFIALLENGNQISLFTGKEKKNDISYENLSLKAKMLYAVKTPDEKIKGIVVNASQVKLNNTVVDAPKNFEFVIKGNKLEIVSKIEAPTKFEWIETDGDIVPDYGYGKNYKFTY